MVQTRRQWRQWIEEERNQNHHMDEVHDQDYNFEEEQRFHINHNHAHPGHYKDEDEVHRHRLNDSEEKTETVRPYKRRKKLF